LNWLEDWCSANTEHQRSTTQSFIFKNTKREKASCRWQHHVLEVRDAVIGSAYSGEVLRNNLARFPSLPLDTNPVDSLSEGSKPII
jgi:hypothetical protein